MSDLDQALDQIVARRIAPLMQQLNDIRDLISGEPQKWLSINEVMGRCGVGRMRVTAGISSGHLRAAQQADARGPAPKIKVTVADADAWARRGCPT